MKAGYQPALPQSPQVVAALPSGGASRYLLIADRCQCLGACPRAGMAHKESKKIDTQKVPSRGWGGLHLHLHLLHLLAGAGGGAIVVGAAVVLLLRLLLLPLRLRRRLLGCPPPTTPLSSDSKRARGFGHRLSLENPHRKKIFECSPLLFWDLKFTSHVIAYSLKELLNFDLSKVRNSKKKKAGINGSPRGYPEVVLPNGA